MPLNLPLLPADVLLAIGEIGSVLVRVLFATFAGLCDVVAAVSCCWRVPYDERPDRNNYVSSVTSGVENGFNDLYLPPTSPTVGRVGVLCRHFTQQGRYARKQEREARKKASELHIAEKRQAREAKKPQAKADIAAAAAMKQGKPGSDKRRASKSTGSEGKTAVTSIARKPAAN